MRSRKAILVLLPAVLLALCSRNVTSQYPEQWVPCVPRAEYVDILCWEQDGAYYVNVSITFAHSGFNVSDWGTPIFEVNNVSVDTKIWMWTGVTLPVIITISNTYNLGTLPAGEYVFTFKAWGFPIKNITFTVIPPVIIKFKPNILEPQARMKLDCILTFSNPYNVNDVNTSSIYIKSPIVLYPVNVSIVDYDADGNLDVCVRFDPYQIVDYVVFNLIQNPRDYRFFRGFAFTVELTVCGNLGNRTFEATGWINIVSPINATPV
ncbi:MAG: hypothetical protein QXH37_01315 [Candidatus Bathyarchaeia archaeon]